MKGEKHKQQEKGEAQKRRGRKKSERRGWRERTEQAKGSSVKGEETYEEARERRAKEGGDARRERCARRKGARRDGCEGADTGRAEVKVESVLTFAGRHPPPTSWQTSPTDEPAH